MTLDPAIRARIEKSFGAQSFMRTLGARLVDLSPGRCTLAAPVGPGVLQQHGAAHAGLAFALGDSAAGYAALTGFGDTDEIMTVEMKINLLRPAVGDRLVAEGRVERAGRRLTVVRAEVFADGAGARKAVALLQGTMIPVPAG